MLAAVRGGAQVDEQSLARVSRMKQRVSSGSPLEPVIGFCRAVRTGKQIMVAGTAPIEPDGSTTPGDAAAQMERCCAIIAKAIADLFARGPATMRAAALEHAAQFSWAHTVDALLASYGHAMHDYRAVHQHREPSSRRSGRRFSMRRGVRA